MKPRLLVVAVAAFVALTVTRVPAEVSIWAFAPPGRVGNVGSGSGPWHIVNTNPRRAGVVFTAPKSGTIDTMEFRIGFVSSPSAVKFAFQGVDPTTGLPDGIDQFRVLASPTTGWKTIGLMTSDGTDGGTKRTVTAGEVMAFTWEWDSTESGQVWLDPLSDNGNQLTRFPYIVQDTGAGWARSNMVSQIGTLALKYDDGTYPFIERFAATNANEGNAGFGTGSTPDEKGALFQLDVNAVATAAWIRSNRAADADLIIYDSSDDEVLNVDLDADVVSGSGGLDTYIAIPATSLSAGGSYRLVLKPTTASQISLTTRQAVSAAHVPAFLGGGLGVLTTRTDGGSWSETTDTIPYMGLKLTLTGGAGGGGGQRTFPFSGGFGWPMTPPRPR